MPDLKDLGFTVQEEGRDPLAPATLDMYRTLYDKPGAIPRKIVVYAYVLETKEAASAHFDRLAEAYRTAPVGTLLSDPLQAGDTKNQPPASKDSTSIAIGDQRKSFVSRTADKDGKNVWTDVYRFGRSVVSVQVLEIGDPAGLRTQVAELVKADAP